MKRALSITFFALLACFALLAARRFADPAGELPGDPLKGALIYDNWILTLDLAPPVGDHPLWNNQESNIRSGVITWRCVECHGWDYKGAGGAYGPYSSHFTGFRGLQSAVGATQEYVLDRLNGVENPAHNFLQYTSTTALNDLAAFLRTQQIDTDLVIDPFTGVALGDRILGAELYESSCSDCHGAAGDELNFGTSLEPLYLGDLAVGDPWQTLHKIRFGTPNTARMPATEQMGWSLSRVADVITYMQSFPRGNPEFNEIGTDPSVVPDEQTQAQVEPIIWGAFVILALVLFNVGWDSFKNSSVKLPSFLKKNRK